MRQRAAAIPADQVAPAPLLTGDDLIAMGYTPGPDFGRVLETIYRAQLDEKISDPKQARTLAERMLA